MLVLVGLMINGCGCKEEKTRMQVVKDLEYGVYDLSNESNIKLAFKCISDFRRSSDLNKLVFSDTEARKLFFERHDLYLEDGSTLIMKYDQETKIYLVEELVGQKGSNGNFVNTFKFASLNNFEIRDSYQNRKVRIITPKLQSN